MEARESTAQTAPAETRASEIPTQVATMPSATEPDSVTGNFEIVELTSYNVRDYFAFEETFYIADKSGCTQYVTLKEEYRDRLIAAENINLPTKISNIVDSTISPAAIFSISSCPLPRS